MPVRGENPNIARNVFEDLRHQILAGNLAPGERLPGERELAARYGTNRNTLREAVRRLEQARLVTVRHGQGVTVADFRRTGTMDLLAPLFEASSDYMEMSQIIQDILPARLLVLEFAGRLAVRRADTSDIKRMRDITDLIISASDTADAAVMAKGFQRWLEALIDAGHSVAIRWVANPFLDSFRELLERFPEVWVMDKRFPSHLATFVDALEDGSEERAVQTLRQYYDAIDSAVREGFSAIASLSTQGMTQATQGTSKSPEQRTRGTRPKALQERADPKKEEERDSSDPPSNVTPLRGTR